MYLSRDVISAVEHSSTTLCCLCLLHITINYKEHGLVHNACLLPAVPIDTSYSQRGQMPVAVRAMLVHATYRPPTIHAMSACLRELCGTC
jgi:hypothetical protein